MKKEKEIQIDESKIVKGQMKYVLKLMKMAREAGQLAEQERSIKLCDRCKPYQAGQNSQKEKDLEMIEELYESKRVFDKGRCFEGFLDIDELKELTQKIKGEEILK